MNRPAQPHHSMGPNRISGQGIRPERASRAEGSLSQPAHSIGFNFLLTYLMNYATM